MFLVAKHSKSAGLCLVDTAADTKLTMIVHDDKH